MKLTDPHELLSAIDQSRWDSLRGAAARQDTTNQTNNVSYVEPRGFSELVSEKARKTSADKRVQEVAQQEWEHSNKRPETLTGRVQCLGDFIDTDAVSSFLAVQT